MSIAIQPIPFGRRLGSAAHVDVGLGRQTMKTSRTRLVVRDL